MWSIIDLENPCDEALTWVFKKKKKQQQVILRNKKNHTTTPNGNWV